MKIRQPKTCGLNKQLLDAVLHSLNLVLQVRRVVGRDRARDHRPRDAARAAQGNLRRNEHVRDVFVFAQQWQMKKDLQRLCISSEHQEFSDSAIQRLCRCHDERVVSHQRVVLDIVRFFHITCSQNGKKDNYLRWLLSSAVCSCTPAARDPIS